jgi:hypothetical protein
VLPEQPTGRRRELRRAITTALTLALILGITEGQSRQVNGSTRQAAVYAGGTETANQQGDGAWRRTQCRYRNLEGGADWSYREVSLTIRCSVNHWPVYGGFDKALSVAQCESGLNELAWNPNGPYGGVFQQSVSAWPYRFTRLAPAWWRLRPWVLNGRSNVVVSIKMAHYYGWGAWTCQ